MDCGYNSPTIKQLNNDGTKWMQIAKANDMEEYIMIVEKHFGLQLRKDFSPNEIATLWSIAESVTSDRPS